MPLASKQRDRPHARVYAECMHLPAWKALKPEAIALLVTVMATYRPNDGNEFQISDRRAAELARCSRPTAVKALASLVETGWLEIETIGKMTGGLDKRGSRYSLTCQPRYLGEQAKMTFLHWRQFSDGQKRNRRRPKSEPPTAKNHANSMQSRRPISEEQALDITSIPLKISTQPH